MECALVDFAKPFLEKLINNAVEKSRFLFCFTCIVKEFDEEKVKLEADMTTMKQRFKVATGKDKEILFNAQFWEKRVDELIQEDTKTKQRCFFGFFPDCIWRYKRGEDLVIKIAEIKMLMEKGEKLENIELDRRLPDVERYSSQYYISFKSRELKQKELLDALKDDSNYLIGLYGMGGTGKTILAKEVGKHLKALELFDHVIDTTVSFTPDIKKIQDDIAGSLGLKWEDCNESDRPKKLWSRLINGEKILVILDDVWGDLNFDNIGIPNGDNHKGCRLLVTTRNLGVCNKMGCGKTIQLELLTEEDAWIMFKMYADMNSDFFSKSFLDKGRKISTQCKRLPVAIATIASSLKGQKRREEWNAALTILQKPVSMAGVEDDLVYIYKCLKFSYDYLKDERAKLLFLFFSIFQEDFEAHIEFLTKLAIGISLFGEGCSSFEDVRRKTIVAKNKLLDSCLLLETENGCVKMHDLVREVAQWIANKEIQRINFSNKNQKSLVERDKNIKYLFCEGKLKDLFSSNFDGSKLDILIVVMEMNESIDVPFSFLENIKGIRLLMLVHDIANYPDIDRPYLSLLQSIQSLKNIRFLIVQRATLGNISILGNLPSLETLELSYCDIDKLPHEIEKLEKLRLLTLRNCNIERNNPFEVIQKCSSLEELHFSASFNDFCKELTLPTTFQRYHVIDEFDISHYSASKCVDFEHDYFTEATYKYVFETAELVRLKKIEKGWRNLMPEIVSIEKGMNELNELHLEYNYKLNCLVDTKHIHSQVPNVFSKLVVLILSKMGNLEALCDGPIYFESLSNLEKLSIERCRNLQRLFRCSLNLCNLKTLKLILCSKLVSVFDLSTSKSLLLLEKLEIIDCEKLENIFTYERRVVDDPIEEVLVDDNKSFNSLFPKLRVVNIQSCHQLQYILPLPSSKELLLLEAITIEDCGKLKYIFGQHQKVKLSSLKKLQLNHLPDFIDIFPESHHSTMPSSISQVASNPQTQLEPIKSNIISWSHICCYGYKMRGITTSTEIPLISEDQPQECSNSTVSNLNCLAQCFSRSISHIICNIKDISLQNLSKIKSVCISSIAPNILWETLTIKNCDELEHIIVDIGNGSGENNVVFPKLKELSIENSKKLECIIGHNNTSDDPFHESHLHFPTLEHLVLRSLPNLIGMCTKSSRTMLSSLTKVELDECSEVDIKSIGDLSVPNHLLSIAQESTTIKELSENMEDFLALKRVVVKNHSKIESIFCFNEVNEQRMNLGLQEIELHVLPMMTCIFGGPKNSFALQNLRTLMIVGCEKLETVFSICIVRSLPQLISLRIEKCKELKHIIEDDSENKKEMSNFLSSRSCFPNLTKLFVEKCNRLKYVFPIYICRNLPKLVTLLITEADELEQIFKSEGDDEKVEIPNLKVVAFVNIPNLLHAQGIQFQVVQFRLVLNCQKLSLTSILDDDVCELDGSETIDFEFYMEFDSLVEYLKQLSKGYDTGNEVEAATEREWTLSKVKTKNDDFDLLAMDEYYWMEQLQLLDEIVTTTKPSHGNNDDDFDLIEMDEQYKMEQQQLLEEIVTTTKTSHGNNLEGSTSEITLEVAETLSTISETKNEPLKQEGIEISVEEGATSTNANTKTSSLVFMNKEPMDQQYLMNQKHPLGESNATVNRPSQEELMNQQQLLGAIDSTIIKPSPENNEEYGDGKIGISISTTEPLTIEDADLQGSHETTQTNNQGSLNHDSLMKAITSDIASQFPKDDEIIVSQSAETRNEPPVQFVAHTQKGVEELATSSPTHLELVASSPEQDVDVINSLETTKTNNNKVFLNDNDVMNVNSIIEEQFPKDVVGFRVSESKPSPSNNIPFPLAPSMPIKDSSSLSLVVWELEQLVSKKHLDHVNLSLLTDFLVKHPSVLLKDTSLSIRYKGYAYNCLADLLKFLQTRSVLDVFGSSRAEFVELLQDVRKCAFDKDWLDGVEKRALFPNLQFSPDVLQKLLDSQHVTKEFEVMHLKIDILSQHVEDLKQQLTSSQVIMENIIQQKTEVLETKAALSAPLGY